MTADAADVIAPNCESVTRGGPGPTAKPRLKLVAGQHLATVLRKGLRARLTGAKPGRAKLVARVGKRKVASATTTVRAAGTATARLRFTRAARRSLRAKRKVRLTISGAGVRAVVTIRR